MTPNERADIRVNPPHNMNEPQAAAYLGVSVRSMRTYREKKLIPCVRLGGRKIYRLKDIDSALDAISKEQNNGY